MNRYLPILSRAETEIKQLIINSALLLKSKAFLRIQIREVIKKVNNELPLEIIDRQSYINGLYFSSERMIKENYDKIVAVFVLTALSLLSLGIIYKMPKNQIELLGIIKKKDIVPPSPRVKIKVDKEQVLEEFAKYEIDIKYEAKAYPNVYNYVNKLKEEIGDVAKTEFAPSEEGKKKITIWQKAELDVRHQEQLKKINDLVADGVEYAWISSHPDCSKRCSAWQGHLVSLKERAKNPQKTVDGKKYNYRKKSFALRKIDGNTVYSLPDIMDVVVAPYGYKNNIIGGFNCRHKLVPYTKGSVAPTEYDPSVIQKQREINAKLREYEREIRRLKRLSIFYKTTDKKLSKMYLERAKELTEEYKEFANSNGYAWLEYRLEV